MSEDAIHKRIPHNDIAALLRVSLALAESLDRDVVLQTAVQAAVELFAADDGVIFLVEGEEVILGASTRSNAHELPVTVKRMVLVNHPQLTRAVRGEGPLFVPNVSSISLSHAERLLLTDGEACSLLFVPLRTNGTVDGVMVLVCNECRSEFTEEDANVCRLLAAQIALAFQNARLFEAVQSAAAELQSAYDATLEGWSLALEMRDEETLGHTLRAAELACDVARALGVPDEDIPHVRRGALLHDIGKMAVPDAILKKPGPLDEHEWAVMRAHPVVAHEFLSRIGYLESAIDIPYYHHERWDGTGYPRGLRGTKIPLSARIFAVIDVYDALTSDRPYRKAWSDEAALKHIVAQAGEHFDPVVVAAFMERIEAERAVAN
jgi:putative nucleotidyltransferase with HDIG domain